MESISVVRRGHVRRAKLYYLRERVGKGTRIKARQKNLREDLAKMGEVAKVKKAKRAKKKAAK